MQLSELDCAVLTHDIPEHALAAGDVGAIVHAYEGGDGFEVEFVTAEGHTLAVLTLSSGDVRPMEPTEILHARRTQ